MKAVRLYKPGDLRVETVEIPSLQPGEVLVKVMAVGICGSDIPRVNHYGAHVSPLTIGHEFSGVIEETTDSVNGFKVGDRITVAPLIPCYKCEWCLKGEYSLCDDYNYYGSRKDGAMAEYIAVKYENLLLVPDNVSFEDAATTDPCANAIHGLERGKFEVGDVVCVYGVGPIGLFAVQVAKLMGAKMVIAIDVWDEKIQIAKSIGADVCINSLSDDPVMKVMEYTKGRGADVVLDTTGAPKAQKDAVLSAAKLGRVVLLGISHQELLLSEKEVDNIMRRQLNVLGSWNSFTSPFPGSDWTKSLELFSDKGMSAKNIISHRLPLDSAPEIFESIRKGGFFFNKIMFYPGE